MNVFGLVRHGPTAWNREKRIQGICDTPLDTEAFDPLPWRALLAAHGPWTRVLTSPLSRARDTARLLFPDQPAAIVPDVHEQNWGAWTGLGLRELRQDFPGSVEAQEARGWDFTPPGGESRREVLERVREALTQAVAHQDGQRIVVVTHLGVIKVVLNHVLGTTFTPADSARVAPRALHLLALQGESLSLVRANIEVS